MKKTNFFSGLAIAALAMGGLFLSHKADNEEQLPSTLMANVEALTRSEIPQVPCYPLIGGSCTFRGKDYFGNFGQITLYGMKRIF